MSLHHDLTQFDTDSSELKKSLIFSTIVNIFISIIHIILLGLVLSVIIYLAADADLNISPYVFIGICILVFVIFIMISLWLHYRMKLKFSQTFKVVIVLPLLRQLFKSTTYSQTCNCEKIIRVPGILNNTWRSVRINDYFDGFNEDYDRAFEFFDFQLFMADGGTKSAIYKGHLLVIEMPWRLEKVACKLFHQNLFNIGETDSSIYPAFKVPEFSNKFVLSCVETEMDGSLYQTQEQQNRSLNVQEPAKSDVLPIKTSSNPKSKSIATEENLIGEFESERKIVIDDKLETARSSEKSLSAIEVNEKQSPDLNHHYAEKPIVSVDHILTREFAEIILQAESRLNKNLYIHIQGDRMFVSIKSSGDILEAHTLDFMRTTDYLEKRVIQELLPIVDMISVGK